MIVLMQKYIDEGRSTQGKKQKNDVNIRLHLPPVKKK